MPKQERRYCALVVDDNGDAAESFARLLEALGSDAVYTTDPRNALAEALRLKPHIAFLDIRMPHIDGYKLAALLRANFSQEELKLVAVTAFDAPEDRAASRRAGFDAHVIKPIDPDLLVSIIKTVLPED